MTQFLSFDPYPLIEKIDKALEIFRQGGFLIVVDHTDRENEGDLILAAEKATAEKLAFMVRYTSGIICVPLTSERLEELEIPQMVDKNTDPKKTAFGVSVDYKFGTTTGVSSLDRAKTIQALVDPVTQPTDFHRPGHIFPLKAVEGGVLKRAGHTEAAVDLARLSGLKSGGVLAEIVNDDGSVAQRKDLLAFSQKFGIPIVSIDELIAYRKETEVLVKCISEARLPTEHGLFNVKIFSSSADQTEHLVLQKGTVKNKENVLVRVHSECLTGDVFGSTRCDCGNQLKSAIRQVGAAPEGLILYMRGHEGRGIGIGSKIAAYHLQDGGLDTVEANKHLGLPVDSREYGIAARILKALEIKSIRLMTNNPLKMGSLEKYALQISERVPLTTEATPENLRYLRTKQEKLGHLLDHLLEA